METPGVAKIVSLAQIVLETALLSSLVPPKAKAGVRTGALFSIRRQTEGTFKGWPGDGKTAHSGTQSKLFLPSWQGPKMNSEVRAEVSRGSLPALVRQMPWAGLSPPAGAGGGASEGGGGSTAALQEFGKAPPPPVGT